MISFRRLGLIVATALALICSFALASNARMSFERLDQANANKLNQEIEEIDELFLSRQYSEAIQLTQQVLALRKKALGPNHPDVALALNTLAQLYKGKGRYRNPDDVELLL